MMFNGLVQGKCLVETHGFLTTNGWVIGVSVSFTYPMILGGE